jgi:hypothetical protein
MDLGKISSIRTLRAAFTLVRAEVAMSNLSKSSSIFTPAVAAQNNITAQPRDASPPVSTIQVESLRKDSLPPTPPQHKLSIT